MKIEFLGAAIRVINFKVLNLKNVTLQDLQPVFPSDKWLIYD